VFCAHKCTPIIWRVVHRGAQMEKTDAHGMHAYEKHNSASMHDCVPDSCTCVHYCGVNRCTVYVTGVHECTPV
jgi:hypothetical protein